MCGVTALAEFGPLKGLQERNFLPSPHLSLFLGPSRRIGPSLCIILHFMIRFWMQTSESAEPPCTFTAASTPAKTAKVPQDEPCQSVTIDSLPPVYVTDVCQLWSSGS